MPIRILLADDHETVRQGLRLLLDACGDMEVVGEVGDGRAAVARTQALNPQVVVLDVSMPHMNGLAATRAIREVAPNVAIVTLTRHNDDAYVKELMAAGVNAYVLKQSPSAELITAIRAVAAGGQYRDRALSGREATAVSRRQRNAPPRPTGRESEVLRLMALGHSNKDIAAALAVSVKTVEVHKANAMRKLGLRGRIDIVKYALLQGWLKEG
jgi:two-component system response regulator NreC